MEYQINLQREVLGTQLMAALEKTASRLKWHYSKSITSRSVYYDSVKIEPSQFNVRLKTGRFFGDVVSANIKTNEQYSKLCLLNSSRGLTKKDLEKLSLTLYDVLR